MTAAARPKKRKKNGLRRQIVAACQLIILSAFAIGLVFVSVTIWNLSTILPKGDGDIADLNPAESTRILAADGQPLATVFMDENREYVPLNKIPKLLQLATIATEDKRFYEHHGVDFRGIARALLEDFRSQAKSQGGSTITQQLARNVYLSQRKSMGRKIQEALLAVQIERKYSKSEILEKYLNQVFYGSGAYGVQAASRTYFGKKVENLDLAECALLAGLPQRPTAYSPYRSMQFARDRRNTVLALMYQENYISEEDKEKAQDETIHLAYRHPSGARMRHAPYFVDYVLDDLVDRFGANTVYKGGLRVYTTLLPAMQATADRAVQKGVQDMSDQHVSQGALVSIDPRTGYIRAMVGGIDYSKSQLNRAYLPKHPRSPGSSFKAFVYAAAFEQGMSPYDRVSDEPISIRDGNDYWRPRDFDDKWYGNVTIKTAVAFSRNVPAIKTIQRIGVDKAIDMAHRLGVKSPLGHNLSLAIGTSGVTALELCSAYGTFANGGNHAEPIAITKITDRDGNVIEENKPHVVKTLDSGVEEKIDECLRAVTTEGTARRIGDAVSEARGKTGTTQDDRDAWFVGYVPNQLVTAVWVGNDDNSRMRRIFGGTDCGPIWIEFMREALKINPALKSTPKPETTQERAREKKREDDRRKRWQDDTGTGGTESGDQTEDKDSTPSDSADSEMIQVRLCADTGLLATTACPNTYLESYNKGEAPTQYCNLHPGRPIGSPTPRRSARKRISSDGAIEPAAERSDSTDEARDPGAAKTESRSGVNRSVGSGKPEGERMVQVTLCLQSGLLATPYCTDTIQKRMPASQVPKKYCNLHGP